MIRRLFIIAFAGFDSIVSSIIQSINWDLVTGAVAIEILRLIRATMANILANEIGVLFSLAKQTVGLISRMVTSSVRIPWALSGAIVGFMLMGLDDPEDAKEESVLESDFYSFMRFFGAAAIYVIIFVIILPVIGVVYLLM